MLMEQLTQEQSCVTAAQKPAEGIVGWPKIRQKLAEGTYHPKPVLRVEIPKPDGRKRKLGIPTVLDRLIQQAIAQVMQEEWEGEFHDNSYGFRPHRNAHQAISYVHILVKMNILSGKREHPRFPKHCPPLFLA